MGLPSIHNLEGKTSDEPFRMASDSLVVKSYKGAEAATLPPSDSKEKSEEFQVYQGVMGRPGVDFPTFSTIPVTSFSCRGVKKSGYYADLDTDCQVFHVCDRNRKISFLCPNGTIFRQSHLICDWWFRVDCGKSVELYDESAEQLAADQKVYKARSEEREKRRRLSKVFPLNQGVGNANLQDQLRDQIEITNSQGEHQQQKKSNHFGSGTRKTQHEKKNSIKVNTTGRSKVANANAEENSRFRNQDHRQQSSNRQQSNEFIINQKPNLQFDGIVSERENIYGAESGSLVEDLTHRSQNLAAQNQQTISVESNYRSNNNNFKKDNSEKINFNRANEYYINSEGNTQVSEQQNNGNGNFRGDINVESYKHSNNENSNFYVNNVHQETSVRTEQGDDKSINQNINYNFEHQGINFDNSQSQVSGSYGSQNEVQRQVSNTQNVQQTPNTHNVVQSQYLTVQTNEKSVSSGTQAAHSNGQNLISGTPTFDKTIQNELINQQNGQNDGQRILSDTLNSRLNSQNEWSQNIAQNQQMDARNRYNDAQFPTLNVNNTQLTRQFQVTVAQNFHNASQNQPSGVQNIKSNEESHISFKSSQDQSSIQNTDQNHSLGIQGSIVGQQNEQNQGVRNEQINTQNIYSDFESHSSAAESQSQVPESQDAQSFSQSLSSHNFNTKITNTTPRVGFNPISVNYLTETRTTEPDAPYTTNTYQSTYNVNGGGVTNIGVNVESRFSSLSRPFQNFNVTQSTVGLDDYNRNTEQTGEFTGTPSFSSSSTSRSNATPTPNYSSSNNYQTTSSGFVNYNQQNQHFNNNGNVVSFNYSTIQTSFQQGHTNSDVSTSRASSNSFQTGNSFATSQSPLVTNASPNGQTATLPFSYQNSNINQGHTREVSGFGSINHQNNFQASSDIQNKNINANYNTFISSSQQASKTNQEGNLSQNDRTKFDQIAKNIYQNGNVGTSSRVTLGTNTNTYTQKQTENAQEIRNSDSGIIASNKFSYDRQELNSQIKSNIDGGFYRTLGNSFRVSDERIINEAKDFHGVNVNSLNPPKEHGINESNRISSTVGEETGTPQFFTTATYPADEEKQFLAETASFGSNREGKSYSEKPKQFIVPPKANQFETATESFYKTTYQAGSADGFQSTQNFNVPSQYSTINTGISSNTPVNQNSQKVTTLGGSQSYIQQSWPSTTFQPYWETTTGSPADNVYFTTFAPDNLGNPSTESFRFGEISQPTLSSLQHESKVPTPASDVNLSLQELNINKETVQRNTEEKSYEDLVREGLEVPPSSGPNAIRSFALYFGATNDTVENQTVPYIQVNHNVDAAQTLSPFELKKKEVVKQVDELVQKNSGNVSGIDVKPKVGELPSSLTVHTQDSYINLFGKNENQANVEVTTTAPATLSSIKEFEFGTTDFGAFTEEPTVINSELTKNDLDGSQSRGIVESDPEEGSSRNNVTPDLRKLAQVFTKALSAYLDDPQAFKKALSEIRPTEPAVQSKSGRLISGEYSAALQEDDEVLDFSDVTKSTLKKKISKEENVDEVVTEPYNSNYSESDNVVLSGNKTSWATNIELTAPIHETLDESQSSYYTPPTFGGRTNAVAEVINDLLDYQSFVTESNQEVDSYFPITTTDSSNQKVGGFQNNNKKTTKYSPYGAELSSSPFPPLGPTSPEARGIAVTDNYFSSGDREITTSFYSHFTQNRTEEEEIQLAKELNNLVLLPKFTTPRDSFVEHTTINPTISSSQSSIGNRANEFLNIKLGNGHTLETVRSGKSFVLGDEKEETNQEVKSELNSSPSTPKGFLITYSLDNSETVTYGPTGTREDIKPTTFSPGRGSTFNFVTETAPPVFIENSSGSELKNKFLYEYNVRQEETSTPQYSRAIKSLERIAELQETLMLDGGNSSAHQGETKKTAEEIVGHLNMTSSTSHALMKMMEMAAKNETYKRLVLLLVNDKSGKNKTAEEARLSLLRALLSPVILPDRTLPKPVSLISDLQEIRSGNLRRSKSIKEDFIINSVPTDTSNTPTTTQRVSQSSTTTTAATSAPSTTTTTVKPTVLYYPTTYRNHRLLKGSKANPDVKNNSEKSELGNIEVLRRTIQNSKNKQVKINSVHEDAILNSDSRAVELLRSLYSLAARWG
ncbi:hypothetical protein RUM44_013118 [Polyplax serrata]|uniref:Chitin-binding type-2 domain-containing protein n=1 Tax=Polyplax serrata TaxID=468196 RepID=A0ABR1BDJ4_POLSC